MEKSFDIQLELSEISLLFNQFIVGLETKLASNKARVSINHHGLNEKSVVPHRTTAKHWCTNG